MGFDAAATESPALPRPHARRLRDVHRSAGWPAGDAIEIDLLAAGLLERVAGAPGCAETLRVTDRGLAVLARALKTERARFDAHESLVRRIAREMRGDGRIAWRTLALRARVDDAWIVARPDVYSVRHTTVEAYLAPAVHEIKVKRSDLLGDLRRPAKRAAYLQMAGCCSYVIAEGIAEADEIPPECGVIVARRVAHGEGWGALEVLRPAPRRAITLPFAAWMALARAVPDFVELGDEEAQISLGDEGPMRGSEACA
ncbi:MAG TPA: hypothetical protein VFR90_05835 [Methylibium sp.]|uniref:hypothetical protein n=1 Tax=Methylibium sp. TaxID=2067992 RepID=UPI002DB58BC1|nr:hypothetical protein [Methylibium sp.]HEU4458624.1 hypothetical protein [Methylibium sp.]